MARLALWPPNPSEFDRATFCGQPVFASVTTFTGHSGSASAQPPVGGTQSCSPERAVTMAAMAPAAPSVWPVVPFTDVTGTRTPASSPQSASSAFDSVASLAGVPVPCAFTCPRSSGLKPPSSSAWRMARVTPSPDGSGAVMW